MLAVVSEGRQLNFLVRKYCQCCFIFRLTGSYQLQECFISFSKSVRLLLSSFASYFVLSSQPVLHQAPKILSVRASYIPVVLDLRSLDFTSLSLLILPMNLICFILFSVSIPKYSLLFRSVFSIFIQPIILIITIVSRASISYRARLGYSLSVQCTLVLVTAVSI